MTTRSSIPNYYCHIATTYREEIDIDDIKISLFYSLSDSANAHLMTGLLEYIYRFYEHELLSQVRSGTNTPGIDGTKFVSHAGIHT